MGFYTEAGRQKNLTPDVGLGMRPREFLMLVAHAAARSPEEAPFWMDGDDRGVLLVGVCGVELQTITWMVLKLYTHQHRLSVSLQGWRHDAFNRFICFPLEKKEVNIVTT